MDTDLADLMRLTQWLSPAFPVSAYAYSHGLEAAIAAGDVASAEDLAAWLEGVIRHGAGWSDAVLMASAMAEDADLPALAALASALAPSAERQRETVEQGAAFARTTGAILGEDFPPEPLPVAIGRAARRLSLAPETVAALALQAFAGALVSAAVRFVPLGQTEGQAVLARLGPIIRETAAEAARAGPDDVGGCAFRSDIASMRHEAMETRIFRT